MIYLACEWFVNAVEWLGVRLEVGPVAVGTILAAAGTALPESVVTLVAVLFGSQEHGDDIAVGAAMGGPLVVGTVAYGVAGVMLIWLRRRPRAAPRSRLTPLWSASRTSPRAATRPRGGPCPRHRDVDDLAAWTPPGWPATSGWFLVIFAVKVGARPGRVRVQAVAGRLFLRAYAALLPARGRAASRRAGVHEDLEPLKLPALPRGAPRPSPWSPQTLRHAGRHLRRLAGVRAAAGVGRPGARSAGGVVALLLSPIATELPETMNAIIWVRQGKAELALANISGAMMIQATVPTAIGLFFTPWLFGTPLVLAGVATLGAVGYLLTVLRLGRLTPGRLAAAALFYLGFAVGLVVTL